MVLEVQGRQASQPCYCNANEGRSRHHGQCEHFNVATPEVPAHESTNTRLPPVPEGVDPNIWTAMGAMFDAKLQPVNNTLNTLTTDVAAIKEHGVSKDLLEASIKPLQDSVSALQAAPRNPSLSIHCCTNCQLLYFP